MTKEDYIEQLVMGNYMTIATNENLVKPEDMSDEEWYGLVQSVMVLVSNYYYDDEQHCVPDFDEWLNEIFFTIQKEIGMI